MNKLTNLIFVFLSVTVLSACASGSKMKNRHYQQWSDLSEEKQGIEKKSADKTIVFIEPSTNSENKILNESVSIHSIVSNQNTEQKQFSTEQSQAEANLQNPALESQSPYTVNPSKFNLKKQFKSSLKLSPMPVSGDLSLLWVIVIILIVLWALGLLVGDFGGLIHLLLLIALILFILWLLRII